MNLQTVFTENNAVTLLSFICGFAILAGALYVFFKRGTDQASKDSNDILRGLVEDQKQEILKLRQKYHDLGNTVQGLQLKVDQLSMKREYLENIIIQALRQHFDTNPTTIETLKMMITAEKDLKTGNTKTTLTAK